ncbi:MAG: HAD-IA family hydrolase [Pseudomonadota bacterium]
MQSINPPPNLPWDDIDTVLLDMDGTLLDLAYDNHVWNELVPAAYATAQGLAAEAARENIFAQMHKLQGSIDYYDFQQWSEFTGADLIELHYAASNLIGYRPGALEFLRWARGQGLDVIIATNADRGSLGVKNEFTHIVDEVDAVVSSHDYGVPKEAQDFWRVLATHHPYDPARSLFLDDNVSVLDSAHESGIAHLIAISQPDSLRPERQDLGYPICNDLHDLFTTEHRKRA